MLSRPCKKYANTCKTEANSQKCHAKVAKMPNLSYRNATPSRSKSQPGRYKSVRPTLPFFTGILYF